MPPAWFLVAAALNFAVGCYQVTAACRLLEPLPRRVRELERSRGRLVDDPAARLRRIERDLHDGAQAQMVAVVMKPGLAKKKLAGVAGGTAQLELERILELADAARRAERVRAVDGRLQITSPPGGPAVVVVELPSRA
jgi:signal transduction histidine kinase